MEVIDRPLEKKNRFCASTNQENHRAEIKCRRKYVQPPRVQAFTPKTTYCPPKTAIDSKTTYHSSYLNDNEICGRQKPILPIPSIHLATDKFENDTTTNLSFQPVWGLFKPKPIVPRNRLCPRKGRMENTTTIQMSFAPKFVPKLEPIVPCGHLRTSAAAFDGTTTTCLSYMNPGPSEPVKNYKPTMRYCQPVEPTAKETTQKLSYLPYNVEKKEKYPWAEKQIYRRPEAPMPGETTYGKSYLENKTKRELPIFPKDTGVFPCGAEFFKGTIYKESFLPCKPDPVTPIIPCQNISLSDEAMICDTTNKLSFQPVKGEKRKPILPRQRKMLPGTGSIENKTITNLSFTPKYMKKPEMIMPCGNISTSSKPLEDKTTTALSYAKPERVSQIPNYKPIIKYCKPEAKVESETVNMLSFQEWAIGPKEDMPWAKKQQYCRPKDKMCGDTVYHNSFPAPGYYIEECDALQEPEVSSTRSPCPQGSGDYY